MFIQLNGQIINYEKTGSGRPLILIHGNGEDLSIWDELTHVLKDEFTIYRPDSRGHGKSADPGVLHYTDMVDDIINFITSLEIDHPILVGFSDGGIISLMTGIKRSDLLGGIISCGANLTPSGIMPHALKEIKKRAKKNKDPFDILMVNEPDIKDYELIKISVPLLVISGEFDMIKRSETDKIVSSVRGSRKLIMRGDDHMSYIIHSDRLAPIIREFTGSIS